MKTRNRLLSPEESVVSTATPPTLPEGAPPLPPPDFVPNVSEPEQEVAPETVTVRWDDFTKEDTGDDAPANETPAVEATPAPAEAAPAQPSVPPAEQAVAPTPPPSTTPTEAAAPTAGTPITLEQLRALFQSQTAAPQPVVEAPKVVDLAEQREKRQQALRDRYAIPPEEAAKFLTEPETILPKLAAELHDAVLEEVKAMVYASVPQMFQVLTAAEQRSATAKKMLFEGAEELVPHEQKVLEIGAFWRQMNPQATPEQAVKGIRELARGLLGVAPNQPATAPTPAPTPVPAGFRPAGVGSAGTAPAKPSSVWSALVDEFDAEDRR